MKITLGSGGRMKTRTGGFQIGFRRGNSAWQQDLHSLLDWSLANELHVIDLNGDACRDIPIVINKGMAVGSVDMLDVKGMISPDTGKRKTAIAQNIEYIKACAANGPLVFFLVMLPDRPDLPRKENFDYMVESFNVLIPVLESHNSCVAIEGWPGPGALCCTPETLRAFFKCCPSTSMGINYDPSHLIRMGIDPHKFLREFGDRVVHAHGKDTELRSENLYEFGSEQPAVFTPRFPYGGWAWRYTIPGHGGMRWGAALELLKELNYSGSISIELEDANFNGTAEGEQMGILKGAQFLAGC
jgi:sugar phosphate isomerase/epimerase